MEVEKSRELGLCFGVRRAIRLLEEAADKYGGIETLGPVAHNQQLVQRLVRAGIKPVGGLGQVRGKILAITTHGVSPTVLSEIEARHIHIIDTTCPIVRQAQNAARELAEAGFYVVIFGEAEHPEVEGLLGWARGRGIATLNAKQVVIPSLSLPAESLSTEKRKLSNTYRLGIISQTTQSQYAFSQFITQLISIFTSVIASPSFGYSDKVVGQFLREIRIINTLCQATQRRREAAIELAERSQLIIVVGGRDSANTRRLAEVCSAIVGTHLVETVNEVDNSWLIGKQRIGVTAGASTPDEAIEEVVAKLKSL